MIKHGFAMALAMSLVFFGPKIAEARKAPRISPPTLSIHIDISSQSMAVYAGSSHMGSFKVSTARAGYWTPRGKWRVQRMARVHWSKQYHAPLPNAIFFVGGIAIHATKGIQKLGTPASHGCVRLAPGDAAKVYGMVARHGMKNTLVTVSN